MFCYCCAFSFTTIVGGSWQDRPVAKIVTFSGNGYVSVSDASKTGINFHASWGVGKFSVGYWFSPSANDATDRYLIHKADQFLLKYKVSTGVLTFGFRDLNGVWHYYDSSSGVVTVGGRLNVVATYDCALPLIFLSLSRSEVNRFMRLFGPKIIINGCLPKKRFSKLL